MVCGLSFCLGLTPAILESSFKENVFAPSIVISQICCFVSEVRWTADSKELRMSTV
jgi:hypothetical protein